MSLNKKYDITIIGIGIVYLATLYGFLKAHMDKELLIIEKEDSVGRNQSGHYFGLRAQALYGDGRKVDDFSIKERNNIIHVMNAPLPTYTSS